MVARFLKRQSRAILDARNHVFYGGFFVFYIYALVDPLTHIVRYVGQTGNLDSRYRVHCSGRDSATRTTWDWLTNPDERAL